MGRDVRVLNPTAMPDSVINPLTPTAPVGNALKKHKKPVTSDKGKEKDKPSRKPAPQSDREETLNKDEPDGKPASGSIDTFA